MKVTPRRARLRSPARNPGFGTELSRGAEAVPHGFGRLQDDSGGSRTPREFVLVLEDLAKVRIDANSPGMMGDRAQA